MVAISLYRGNLHRVPPNPARQWPMPPPAISLHDFRRLIQKRAQALSRLPGASGLEIQEEKLKHEEEGVCDNGCSPPEAAAADPQIGTSQPKIEKKDAEGSQELQAVVGDCAPAIPDGTLEEAGAGDGDDIAGTTMEGIEEGSDQHQNGTANPLFVNHNVHTNDVLKVSNNMDVETHKEDRKMELEKKLKVLNEKKHNLVQMLKQILNAEEEIKRRSIQSPSIHASPLQVETVADMGSVTRHAQKISVEVNFGGDISGEPDAAANHSILPHSLHPMQSTSPSTTSHMRTNHGHNAVPNNNRSPLQGHTPPSGVTGISSSSPPHFAPTIHQGQATSLPAVSVPGTNYCPSTPSPAGLGGASSVFKDSHLTSPS